MLPALSSLVTQPTYVTIRPLPLSLEEGRCPGVAAQELEVSCCEMHWEPADLGSIPGLDFGVSNLKTLLRAFLSSVSVHHRWVARSVAVRLKARLIRVAIMWSQGSVSLDSATAHAYWSANSLPATPRWPGTQLMEMVLPWSLSVWASSMISRAIS